MIWVLIVETPDSARRNTASPLIETGRTALPCRNARKSDTRFEPLGSPSYIAAAATLAVLLLPLIGCTRANTYVAPPPPDVEVAQGVTEDVVDYLEKTGTIRALEAVDLRARVSGYLQSVEFRDGAYVEKGQLLFVIEPEPFKVALALEKAKLRKAEAVAKLAEAEVERARPLAKRGALSVAELDIKLADRDSAAADVAAAEAAVAQAELNLQYTRITAPISGRIGRHMVDVGNLVQTQTTILTSIEKIEPIYVYFYVSENDVLQFIERKASDGAGADTHSVMHVGLSEAGGFPYEGELDYVELGVDPNTGTQQRRGVFLNKDHSLLPGMFVRVRIPLGSPAPQLLVNERAVGSDQRGAYVLVVNEKNIVERRSVELGVAHNGKRVVKQGLSAGEWIVVNGLQRARPGAPVNPQKIDAKAEAVAETHVGKTVSLHARRGEARPREARPKGG
jgi:RND family efflux transporter MFP subunit